MRTNAAPSDERKRKFVAVLNAAASSSFNVNAMIRCSSFGSDPSLLSFPYTLATLETARREKT